MKDGGGGVTGFLFATPGFLSGMGKALDLWGAMTAFNGAASAEEADRLAVLSDWLAVGEDMRNAIKEAGCREAVNDCVEG